MLRFAILIFGGLAMAAADSLRSEVSASEVERRISLEFRPAPRFRCPSRDNNSTAECTFDFCVKHFQLRYIDGERCIFGAGRAQFGRNSTRADTFVIVLEEPMPMIAVRMRALDADGEEVNAYFYAGPLPLDYTRLDRGAPIEFRRRCAPHWFGQNCARRCEVTEADRRLGRRFVCDADGERQCAVGFGGQNCDHAIDCDCKNGRCDAEGGCICAEGFRGNRCDECVRSAGCLHGFCSRPFECVCFPGFAGPNCSYLASVCDARRPCLNGGQCLNGRRGAYECRCAAGFGGAHCERTLDECSPTGSPCQNGGECVQRFGHPLSCRCADGFFGQFCQIEAANCADRPCQNGGTCVTVDDEFHCLCPNGFSGDVCDRRRALCRPDFCANGGICLENMDRPEGVECRCPPGFFGPHCQMVLIDCRSSPCLNNGICSLRGVNSTSYQCHCPMGFAGHFCELAIRQFEDSTLSMATLSLLFVLAGALIVVIPLLVFAFWTISRRTPRSPHFPPPPLTPQSKLFSTARPMELMAERLSAAKFLDSVPNTENHYVAEPASRSASMFSLLDMPKAMDGERSDTESVLFLDDSEPYATIADSRTAESAN